MLRHVLWLIGIALLSIVVGTAAAAVYLYFDGSGAPSAKYWPKQPVTQFSNDDWRFVLDHVVRDNGYAIDYDVLLENRDGARDALYRYVALIASVSPRNRPELFTSDDEKLAYYLNAYNALAMYGVLERGLPRNVARSLLFWINYYPVGGDNMNLDQLEKRHVRSVGDPRVHFALNCMSYSCPPLRREPYEGSRLHAQLDEQGRLYLGNARAVKRVDDDTVALSELFTSFYGEEIKQAHKQKTGEQNAGLLEALRPFAAEDSPIQTATDYVTLPYNWSLNRAP